MEPKAVKPLLTSVFSIFFALAFGVLNAGAQTATVTVTLDERFFDTLLNSVFQNFEPPEFPVAKNGPVPAVINQSGVRNASFAEVTSPNCSQTVKILREMNGVRTAVRFKEGKIYVPLAFSGNYAPPFVGCVEFAGWAEANVDLEFEQKTQRLVGRVRVFNVNLNGTGGIGGALIARMLQASIDKKMNPIEVLTLDKLSFGVPVQGTGKLRMNAAGVRPVMGNGVINIQIDYVFSKE
jgi:hypothetical protein